MANDQDIQPVTSTGLLKLTQVEIEYLQSFLDANDRGGYYLALYNMTGVTQVLVQGEISTFSGAAGGAAYVANMKMYDTIPDYKSKLAAYIARTDGYQGRAVTLDTFSNIIAQTDLNVIKEYVKGKDRENNSLPESTGYLDDRAMLDKAVLAWDNIGIQDLFPGNILDGGYEFGNALKVLVQLVLTHGMYAGQVDIEKLWNKLKSEGTAQAFLAVFGGKFMGKELRDFEGRAGYKIVELPDAKFKVAIDTTTNMVAGIFRNEFIPDNLASVMSAGANYWNEIIGFFGAGALGSLTAANIGEVYDQIKQKYKEEYLMQPGPYSMVPTKWADVTYPLADTPTNQQETLWGTGGIIASIHDDTINGSLGDDRIFGGDGGDILSGSKGNDILYGQDGEDTLYGGDNDDILRGGADDDFLDGGTGNDQLDGGDISDKASGNDTLIGGLGDDILAGNDGDDILFGDLQSATDSNADGNDKLYGGKGDDQLFGGGGNDYLHGGEDNDLMMGGKGNDRLLGAAGNDKLFGGDGNDYLHGGSGDDELQGGTGNDILIGGSGAITSSDGGDGNDLIYADKNNAYDDILAGGSGNDIIYGFNGNNLLSGGAGSDLLYGGNEIDNLDGGDGNDFIYGADGVDVLVGNEGNDFLLGGNDDDILEGEIGADRLQGDQGLDQYLFRQDNFGTDTIVDNDGDGIILLNNQKLTVGEYNQAGRYWESGDGQYEIRKVGGTEGRTTLIINKKGDNKNTIFVEDWKNNGDLGLTFSQETTYQPPVPTGSIKIANDGNNIIGNAPYVQAGAGNDYIHATNNSDRVYGGTGNDVINTGGGDDFIDGGSEDDLIFGGFGQDTIYGGSGNDLILSSATLNWQRNVLERQAGFGDGESDELKRNYAYVNYYFTPQYDERTASYTYYLVDSNGVITTTQYPFIPYGMSVDGVHYQMGNTLTTLSETGIGDSGADTVYGGGGDDFIVGSGDADYLNGEDDDDHLYGRGGDDQLYGGAGNDYVNGGIGRDFISGGIGNDNLVGGYESDVIYGGAHDDSIHGDLVNLYGTDAPPLSADANRYGDDLIYGDGGNDKIWGGGGNDTLHGGNDNDQLSGEEGDDYLFGEQGDDDLFGDVGNDYLFGGIGNDYLYGGAGHDYLEGGEGGDTLNGQAGDDILDGGANADMMFGGTDNDILRGQAGVDRIYGEDGDDILEGGLDKDYLYGGKGSDIYIFNIGDGQDVITEEQNDIKSLNYDNYIYFNFESSQIRQVHRDQLDLLIEYGASDQVRVKDYYKIRNSSHNTYLEGYEQFDTIEISEFRFEDGTVWDTSDIMQMSPPPDNNELPPDPLEGVAYFIDALVTRNSINLQGKTTITYSFPVNNASGSKPYYTEQVLAIKQALAQFAQVLNITFEESTTGSSDLKFYLDDLTDGEAGAAAGYASAQTGEVHINSLVFTTPESLNPATQGFEVLLHEIGHALGLKHPFEAPVLPEEENNENNTQMSYTDNGTHDTTLGMFDIAALQYIHGVNKNVRVENNTYTFADKYIWDGAGIDTFDASGQTVSVTIDLNQGGWSYIGEKNQSILAAGQTFIGYGTQIENAVGGSGNDKLIGNLLDNILQGGSGQDIYQIDANGGQDKIIEVDEQNILIINNSIEEGKDYYLNGKFFIGTNAIEFNINQFTMIKLNDSELTQQQFRSKYEYQVVTAKTILSDGVIGAVIQNSNGVEITANLQNNYIYGDKGDDTIYGKAGNDHLYGGAGNDQLDGGTGNDILEGGDGVDTLYGGEGADILQGGTELDTYVFNVGDGLDVVDDSSSENIIKLNASLDDVSFQAYGNDLTITYSETDQVFVKDFLSTDNIGNLELLNGQSLTKQAIITRIVNQIDGTERADILSGHPLVKNIINGYAGDDHLYGGTGNDQLDGGTGNDILEGGDGVDTLYGGDGADILQGGTELDTYVFNVGDGLDVVDDSSSENIIKLNASLDDVSFQAYGNDLTITYSETDQVFVKDFLSTDNIGNLELLNGQSLTKQAIITRIVNQIDGTERADILSGHPLVKNIINGYAGDDHLYGGTGNDQLDGGTGNDILEGGDGADLLNGGLGEDILVGGNGVDTYHFSANSGVDYINDNDQSIIILNGVEPEDINLERENNILTINYGNQSKIIINNYQNNINKIIFDNLIWEKENIQAKVVNFVKGTAGNDVLRGKVDLSEYIYGFDGDDKIYGGLGDSLYGGDGNDVLDTSYQNNIKAFGEEGNDRFNSYGATNAQLNGGEGDDYFEIGTGGYLYEGVYVEGGLGYDIYDISNEKNKITNGVTISDEDGLGKIYINYSVIWAYIQGMSGNLDNTRLDAKYDYSSGTLSYYYFGELSFRFNNIYSEADIQRIGNLDISVDGATYSGGVVFGSTEDKLLRLIKGTSTELSYTDNDDIINDVIGSHLSNKIYAKAGNDTITVSGQDYYVYADEGDDIINAAGGRIFGGTGNDTINITNYGIGYGEEGNDILTGHGLFYGGEDHDILIADNEGAYMDGGLGADHLVGGLGDDIFVIDEFDTFEETDPEGGYDTLINYSQNIDLSNNNFEAVTLSGIGNFYAKGDEFDNELIGNDGDNLLEGRQGNDSLKGGAGNDILDGGIGADILIGGSGDDYYVVDRYDILNTNVNGTKTLVQGDQVIEDTNIIFGQIPVDGNTGNGDTIEQWDDHRFYRQDTNGNWTDTGSYYHLQDNIENLILKGAAKTAFGNELDNIITGNEQNNYIDGLGGNDTYVYAKGGGTDTLSFNDDIEAVNTLKIEGYSTNDVFAQKQGNSVYLSFKNSSDHIWLSNHYVADTATTTNKVDQIVFDSGVIWTQADIDALVNRAATNHAPTVNRDAPIPLINTSQGNTFSYTIAANVITDSDPWDSLTFKVTSNTQGSNGQYNPIPAWLSFDPATRTLSGTPPTGTTGNLTFLYWGTDMYGQGAGTYFTLKVNPPNRAPVVATAIADQTFTDGKAFSYVIPSGAFTDADGDALTYSATLEDGSTLPAWLTFNAITRTLSGTSPDNSSPLNIKITAKDIVNQTASDVFKLTFAVQNLTVNGTTGVDTLYGGSGNDNLTGQAGNDILYGYGGNDTLDGGTGTDTMYGGKGDDTYVVDVNTDVINENVSEGIDTVKSSVTLTLTNANVENLTLTGTTAINGTGNALNNTLIGNSAVNTLTGLAGDDILDGGAGNDVLVGGIGNDTYIVDSTSDSITEAANEGIDLVQSSVSYTLANNVENLTLTGTSIISGTGNVLNNIIIGNSANNTLSGAAGDDRLEGNAGNDTLDGGAGNDTLLGGIGDDTYIVDSSSDTIIENAAEGTDSVQSSVTYTLSDNIENLTLTGTGLVSGTGNSQNNVLTGNSAVNTLTGGAGDDTLNGGAGNDTLIGGIGNDTYVVDSISDVINENANEGIDTIQSSITRTIDNNVENLTLTGTTAINGTGNALNNIIIGNSAVNILSGGAGDDTLDGGAGNDKLTGGLGNDIYVVDSTSDTVTENANEGTDTIQSAVTRTLDANVENLTLTGTGATSATGNTLNNILIGNSAINTLTGLAGDDYLDGGAGADKLIGGVGNDTYVIDNTGDVITENANEGTDSVQSSITYTLGNNLENLTLIGSGVINGTGNTLANTLKGNTAANTLTGGTGNDTYLFDRSSGIDTLVENDATSGNKDTLSFGSDIAANQLWFTKSGNNLEVSVIGTSNKAVMKDWYLGNQYHVEQLKSGNNLTLLDTQVQNLVQAMAGMTPPPAGQTSLPPEYQTQLNAVITANWK